MEYDKFAQLITGDRSRMPDPVDPADYQRIADAVAAATGVTVAALDSITRSPVVARARYLIYALLCDTGYTCTAIGRWSGYSRQLVMRGIAIVRGCCEETPELAALYQALLLEVKK